MDKVTEILNKVNEYYNTIIEGGIIDNEKFHSLLCEVVTESGRKVVNNQRADYTALIKKRVPICDMLNTLLGRE